MWDECMRKWEMLKKHDALHYHYKRANKREKEMEVGRHTCYYIFALMKEGANKCPNVRNKLTITNPNRWSLKLAKLLQQGYKNGQ